MKNYKPINLLILFLIITTSINCSSHLVEAERPDNWWNSSWHYRSEMINVGVMPYDQFITIRKKINFMELLQKNNCFNCTFDENSIRVIEVDEKGNTLKEEIFDFRKYPDPNFVIKSDFEMNVNSIKSEWAPNLQGYDVSTIEKHSGFQSVILNNTNKLDARGLYKNIVINQIFVKPVIISGWNKAENVSGIENINYSICADIEYYDGKQSHQQILQFKTGTHDWEYVEKVIYPKKPIKSIKIYIQFRNHLGAVWFDDIQIISDYTNYEVSWSIGNLTHIETTKHYYIYFDIKENGIKEYKKPSYLDNLLYNSGFEMNDEVSLYNWTPYGMGYSISTLEKYSGFQSVILNNTCKKDIRGVSQKIMLNPPLMAKPLVLSGWTKAENVKTIKKSDYSIHINLTYCDGTYLYKKTPQLGIPRDWKYVQLYIYPNKSVKSIKIYCIFQNNSGVVWFDDIYVGYKLYKPHFVGRGQSEPSMNLYVKLVLLFKILFSFLIIIILPSIFLFQNSQIMRNNHFLDLFFAGTIIGAFLSTVIVLVTVYLGIFSTNTFFISYFSIFFIGFILIHKKNIFFNCRNLLELKDGYDIIYAIIFLIILLFSSYIYFYHSFHYTILQCSDVWFFFERINMLNNNLLFTDYSPGYLAFISALSIFPFNDIYSVMCFIGPLIGVLISIAIYFVTLRLTGNIGMSLFAMFISNVSSIFYNQEMIWRQILPVPQNFAFLFWILGFYYGLTFILKGGKIRLFIFISSLTLIFISHDGVSSVSIVTFFCLFFAGILSRKMNKLKATQLIAGFATSILFGYICELLVGSQKFESIGASINFLLHPSFARFIAPYFSYLIIASLIFVIASVIYFKFITNSKIIQKFKNIKNSIFCFSFLFFIIFTLYALYHTYAENLYITYSAMDIFLWAGLISIPALATYNIFLTKDKSKRTIIWFFVFLETSMLLIFYGLGDQYALNRMHPFVSISMIFSIVLLIDNTLYATHDLYLRGELSSKKIKENLDMISALGGVFLGTFIIFKYFTYPDYGRYGWGLLIASVLYVYHLAGK